MIDMIDMIDEHCVQSLGTTPAKYQMPRIPLPAFPPPITAPKEASQLEKVDFLLATGMKLRVPSLRLQECLDFLYVHVSMGMFKGVHATAAFIHGATHASFDASWDQLSAERHWATWMRFHEISGGAQHIMDNLDRFACLIEHAATLSALNMAPTGTIEGMAEALVLVSPLLEQGPVTDLITYLVRERPPLEWATPLFSVIQTKLLRGEIDDANGWVRTAVLHKA